MNTVSVTPSKNVVYEINSLSLLDSVEVQLDDAMLTRVKAHQVETLEVNNILRSLYLEKK